MKKYIAIALLMVLGTVYPAYARWSVGTAGGGVAATPAACSEAACSGCTYEERFECGANDNEERSWTTVSGTTNFDYTTDKLSGDESLFLSYSDTPLELYFTITGTDNAAYISSRIKIPTGNSGSIFFFRFWDSEGNVLGSLRAVWATDHYNLRMYYNAGNSNSTGATSMSVDTLYYIKLLYNNGTGNNATWTIWLSTDGTNWSQEATQASSTDTAQLGRVGFLQSSGSMIIDSLRVRTDGSDVGNY